MRVYNTQAVEQFTQSAEGAAALWKTACECANSLLSNVPEQMAAAYHSFNLLTARIPIPGELSSSSLTDSVAVSSGTELPGPYRVDEASTVEPTRFDAP